MPLLEAFIFGIVQGITEFLPISSTAHIIITELLFGYEFPGLAFEIFLHQASVLAVIIYFRRELLAVITGFFQFFKIKNPENRAHFNFALYIVVATALTGSLGLLLKGQFLETMKTPPFIGAALLITGAALVYIERFREYGGRREGEMTIKDAILIGLAQTAAVLPGISRSGATVVAGLWVGLERDTAVRYSFLLAIPVILGSSILAIKDLSIGMWDSIGAAPLLLAFTAAFIFSWIGIVWLIDFLKKGKLIYYALYCFALAALVIFFL